MCEIERERERGRGGGEHAGGDQQRRGQHIHPAGADACVWREREGEGGREKGGIEKEGGGGGREGGRKGEEGREEKIGRGRGRG